MNNMRRGFTMIELIFVIVIIGILAAVAIPKLAATRTDAQAAVCVHEAGQLLSEITGTYTIDGYAVFNPKLVMAMTNINSGANAAALAGTNGVLTTETVGGAVGSGANYFCDGVAVVEFAATQTGTDYNLTITPAAAAITTSPAAEAARQAIIAGMANGNASYQISL